VTRVVVPGPRDVRATLDEPPTLVVCGERDDTVDCERVADTVGPFLAEHTSPAGPE
jgi:hypothetical protein